MIEPLAIGAMARATGLGVSALRFYDREGVLVPARTDPRTGYRRYSADQVPAGRALATLRLAGMPLADLGAALEVLDDAASLRDLLAAHRDRLTSAHTTALRALDRVQREAADPPAAEATELGAPLPALVRALAGVRHAVGPADPLPVLAGVLIDRDADGVHAVATDRYRLARHRVDGAAGGSPSRVLLPVELVDRILALDPTPPGESAPVVGLTCGGGRVRCTIGALVLDAVAPAGEYPDHRALLPLAGAPAAGDDALDTAAVLQALLEAQDDEAQPWSLRADVAVDRGYLWDAVRSVRAGEVVLPTPGATAPVLLRSPDEGRLSLVMPVRPDPSPSPGGAP